jgi:hypothetical protein
MNYVSTRTIAPGQVYHINSSMGYSGIISGKIVVDAIKPFNQIDPSYTIAYLDVAMQSYDAKDSPDTKQHVVNEIHKIAAEPWVAYTYTRGEETGQQYLPMYIFADHISTL